MKKRFIYLCVLLMTSLAFAACSDDEKEVPPTPGEIAKSYSADKLKAQVDGKEAPAGASVDIVTAGDNSVSLKLTNIVPGVKSYTIPRVSFQAMTKASYYSALTGSVTDNVLGLNVTAEGKVENDILDIDIKIGNIEGNTQVNAKIFREITMKGNMQIDVMGTAVDTEQRVYVENPWSRDSSQLRLRIRDFQFQGVSIGDITLDTLQIEKRGDVYGLKPETRKLSLVIGDVSVDVRGAFAIQNADTTLQLNLMIDASPLTVYVDFNGKMIKENPDTKATITVEGDAIVEPVAANGSTYKFKVWESTPADQLLLTPKIEIPKTARLDSVVVYNDKEKTSTKIDDKTAIDFSKLLDKDSYVAYYVMPEDVRYPSKKLLKIERIPEVNPVYTMEQWKEVIGEDNQYIYYEPQGLATSNEAAVLLKAMEMATVFPITKENDNAAKVVTLDTKGADMFVAVVPAVTAGTLFAGVFKLNGSSPLKSTQFGVPYRKKPVTLKVTYRYTPGPRFYETKITGDEYPRQVEAIYIENKTDECSINAYLYEVASFDETLDGTNINSSDKVVLKATLPDGNVKADYVSLELPFEAMNGKSYDASKKYKLAIVCSSSKEGDAYKGAPESTLWVKHLEVVSEN